MSEGIVIGVVQSEKCGMGNGTFKQNYFENTLTFVSKPSPDHSTRPYPEKTNVCLLAQRDREREQQVVCLFTCFSNLMTIQALGYKYISDFKWV